MVVSLTMQQRWSMFSTFRQLELSTRWGVLHQELATLALQVRDSGWQGSSSWQCGRMRIDPPSPKAASEASNDCQ